jgi:radical SAM-linked protein
MHCFERMLRRADLPFCFTQGYHPKPRLAFSLSLALGVVGCEEVVELELVEPFDPEDVRQRLARQCPAGLEFLQVCRVTPRTRAQVCRVHYRLTLPPECLPDLPSRISQLLQSTVCWIDRARPKPRRFNLRPFLHDLRLDRRVLEMSLWVTPTGAVRPEEVLHFLGLDEVVAEGVILERNRMELTDEIPPEEREELFVRWASLTAEQRGKATEAQRESPAPAEEHAAAEPVRTAPPAPLLPGPLSFDT